MVIPHLTSRRLRTHLARAARRPLLSAVALLATGCGVSQTGTGREAKAPEANASVAASPHPDTQRGSALHDDAPSTSAEQVTELERSLAEEATLGKILRVAVAKNPDLAEARELARAQRELAPAAGRLPDPEFEYQLWAQPLLRPLALDEAQMHMFGVRQSFPAPGSLGARSEAASARANVAAETRRARQQDLVARVRRAYAEYYRADREYRIHMEHGELAQRALDIARATYQGGRGSQQDVLRVVVAMSRVHNDVATIDGDRRTARGLLNTLMARPTDAPLGPPVAIDSDKVEVRTDELTRLVAERRPEIAAAESAIRARESEAEAARSTGRWPNFIPSLGLGDNGRILFLSPSRADGHLN
jgi:outer membrane protein TolC